MEGISLQTSKLINKTSILKIVTMQGPVSRLQLHQLVGLSKMTISNLVTEYLEANILQKVAAASNGSAGRKTDLIDVVPDSLLTFSIQIRADAIQAGIVNLKGAILKSETMPLTPEDDETTFSRKLHTLIEDILSDEHDYAQKLWGVGVSARGPLDIKNGIILKPPYKTRLSDISIIESVKPYFDLPIYLENDVNVSALAELYFSNIQEFDHFIYASIDEFGIGSGIIINRELYQGYHGFSGELGHVSIKYNGKPCRCGNTGCLELYASINEILDWYAKRSGQKRKDFTSDWLSLIDGVINNDGLCVQALDLMCEYLSCGITSLVNIVDPQCIFLGGSIGPAIKLMIPKIQGSINKRRFSPVDKIEVRKANAPGMSGFIGTAALVMEQNRHVKGPSESVSCADSLISGSVR